MRLLATASLVTALLASLAAQDLGSLEQELQRRYLGQELTFQQPYHAAKITFDRNGHVVGKPVPTCEFLRPLRIDSLTLTRDSLVLRGTRTASQQVLIERSRKDSAPHVPPVRIQHAQIRLLSGGRPWDMASIDAGIARIQRGPEATRTTIPNPTGARPPTPGGDARIAYLLPEGPVYKVGEGVTAPRAIHMPDPEYSEAARKAKVCGYVELKAVVLQDGHAAYVRAASPSIGYGLDEKSVEAVKGWQFSPAQLNGRPVNAEIAITTSFRLY